MENFIDFIRDMNILQIIVIFGGMKYFYNRLDKKIDKMDERIDKLSEKVEDIDRRLCRIEGSLSSHGHCLFNQSQSERKIQ